MIDSSGYYTWKRGSSVMSSLAFGATGTRFD